MYRRCLVCDHEFAANDALEHLTRGRRVAYDPEKGRLWLVCRSCSRWSLVPMESRWEALDELEKLVRDEARTLSSTDNVALMRAGTLEIVRVGRAKLREEAWWRYGRELSSAAKGSRALGGWDHRRGGRPSPVRGPPVESASLPPGSSGTTSPRRSRAAPGGCVSETRHGGAGASVFAAAGPSAGFAMRSEAGWFSRPGTNRPG